MRAVFMVVVGFCLMGCATKQAPGRHDSKDDRLSYKSRNEGRSARSYGNSRPSVLRSGMGDQVQPEAPAMERVRSAKPAGPPQQKKPPTPQAPRMVHYNGHVKLQVSRPDETIEAVVAQAKEVGGYVERQSLTSVSLRVPVAKFREMYDWVLGKGDVLRRSMSARDVTDAHFALDLRLRTARKTRDRLQQLLAKTEDENTKIALLKQIQRLTVDVDRMERQLKTLTRLASMSRLHVEAKSRAAMVGTRGSIPISGFGWIGRLSPFSRAVAQTGKELKLDTPKGLVALSDQDHFQAESADGVIFWTTKLENRPEGEASFWLAAIKERIASEFASAEEGKVGGFLTLRLVAPSDEPYVYTLALRVDGDTLHLVETYYPSVEAEKRHRAQIEAVLSGGAS